MKSILEVDRLAVRFGAQHAVRNLSFKVHENEMLALVGESGCGKSTTALAVMRLLPSSATLEGKIEFEGRDLVGLSKQTMRSIRGNAISMIFQEPMTSLNPVMTVGQQIVEVLRRHEPLSAGAAWQRAVELLDLVRLPEPASRANDYPHNLSGGQRQRVMIAMAVACRPRLLIADEPTTALDVTIQAQILQLLDSLRRDLSMAVLLITHDLGVVGQYANRVAVMYSGETVEDGTTQRIFTHPRHPYTKGLLGASLTLDQNLHYRTRRLTEIRSHIDTDTGLRDFSLSDERIASAPNIVFTRSPYVRPPAADKRPPLLSVRDLVTSYPGKGNAVDGVSFDVGHDETVGLVGESGCGKSTLSRTILRLIPSASGTINLDDQDITHLGGSKLRAIRPKIQMIFQDPYASLNPRQRVLDILDAALIVHGVSDKHERRRHIADITDRVGLASKSLQRFAHEFSGGQRQRIGIARALVLQPKLVICDEPVSALDVSIRAQVLNLLVELKQSLGLSYLFISHDLSVVRYIADRVLVMNSGKIVESGDHESIWSRPAHAYTRSLIDAVPKPAFARRVNDKTAPFQDDVDLPFSFYRFAI
ncbi:ABC transporter ATP-binding protein [Caballeronia sp. dw_276]|jgi:peptide/nickel transport system ATP-binding protein|uniref:ABC transporter ATP-binding protein n=1 Tax=Caballeronia sp. dw_276 TaxID=2719795 RepID=UPI001BD1DDBB|nr:ABC transporter ATP-binding protein [Caballeronia sp. dw_276]